MPPIPDIEFTPLSAPFKKRIDDDCKAKICIWCKVPIKKHPLLDCPNAYPAPEHRTQFSAEVFGAGEQDMAVAYVHHLQQEHAPRKDGETTFSSGRLRWQLSTVKDVPKSVATSTAAATAAGTTTPTPAPAPAPIPVASTPVAGSSSAAAATTGGIQAKSGGKSGRKAAAITPVVATSTAPAPASFSSTATAPMSIPTIAAAPAFLPPTANISTSNLSPTDADKSIPVVYENENIPVPPRRSPPTNADLTRVGRSVQALPDTGRKLSALQDEKLDFHRREQFVRTKGEVYTNHYLLSFKPDQKLYKYRIDSNFPGKNRRKIRAVIKSALDSYSFLSDNKANFATDHIDTIIAWEPIHLPIGTPHVKLSGDGQEIGSEWKLQPDLKDELRDITVRFIYESNVDLASFLKHTEIDPDCANVDLEPAKRALNIMISKCFEEATPDTVQVGSNRFFAKRGTDELTVKVGRGERKSTALCTMRGYFYTVKAGVRNVLLNINPSTSAVFNPVKVSEVMQDTLTFNPRELEGVLRGLRVRIELERGDKTDTETFERLNTPQARTKTIRGLGQELQREEFRDGYGVTQNVYQHLSRTYPNRTLNHPDLPAVNLGSVENPKWYSPEDLSIMPYQIFKSIVPSSLADSMVKTATILPYDAAARIDIEALEALGVPRTQNSVTALPHCPVLTIDPNMVLVPSSRLQYPTIMYSRDSSGQPIFPATDRWNIIKRRFVQTNKSHFRILVLVDANLKRGIERVAQDSFQQFAAGKTGQQLNYDVAKVDYVGTETLINPKSMDEMKGKIESFKKRGRGNFNFLLLLLRSKDAEAYSHFKDLSDRQFGLSFYMHD